jgi:hypothetical protein
MKIKPIDKIISVNGFGVENTVNTQCNYMLVALTESGKVLLSTGDKNWCDVSAHNTQQDDDERVKGLVKALDNCLCSLCSMCNAKYQRAECKKECGEVKEYRQALQNFKAGGR